MANADTPARVLPSNSDLERSFLGVLVQDCDQLPEALDLLPVEDIHTPRNVAIYRLMIQMGRFDLITLSDAVRHHHDPERFGGHGYVLDLPKFAPSTENLAFYAERLNAHAVRRRLIFACQKIIAAARDGDDLLADLVSGAVEDIAEAAATVSGGEAWKALADLAPAAADLYEARSAKYLDAMARGMPTTAGVPTTITAYDKLYRGVIRGAFDGIGGTSGMGKSAFGLAIAERVATQGHGVGVFSLEMPDQDNLDRLVSAGASVFGTKIADGSFNRTEHDGMLDELTRLSRLPLYLDQTPGLDFASIRQRTRRLKAKLARTKTPLLMVVIDYLQLLKVSIRQGGNMEQALGDNADAMKELAKSEDINVTALIQLNQECDKRTDHRPVASDVRGSGRIRMALDRLTLLYRPSRYDDTADPTVCEAILAKNRGGSEGVALIQWSGPTTSFSDFEVPREYRATGPERTDPESYPNNNGWRTRK